MRDFIGYGNRFPDVKWPNDSPVAVSFVLNFEEGSEFSVADGDSINESIYEVIDRQEGLDPCIDSHFEYGTRVGYWRIVELAAQYGIPLTLSVCGRAAERSPWLVQDAAARGHEIAAHGYRWETHAGMSVAVEREVIEKTVQAIEAATGQRPRGWHTRSVRTAQTRSILVENGFLYDSDAYNDDTPYFVDVNGQPHLVLPYAFDTNDMQFQNTQRFATGASYATYICDSFDWLRREGQSKPRMLSVGMHLRMISRPGRIGALERIFEHLRTRGGAWIATREQIARHWIANASAGALESRAK